LREPRVVRASADLTLKGDRRARLGSVIPALPGCYSQGATVEEALANARDAILLTIEDMRERGEPIPDPAGELVRQVAVGE